MCLPLCRCLYFITSLENEVGKAACTSYIYLLSTHLKITPRNAQNLNLNVRVFRKWEYQRTQGSERSTGYKGTPRIRGSVALILFNTLSVICYNVIMMCLRVLSLEEVFNFLCVLEMSPIRSVCSAGSSRYARSNPTCLQGQLVILDHFTYLQVDSLFSI